MCQKGVDVYDLYDQSFLVDSKCSKCGSQLISHPTDECTCSNPKCEDYNTLGSRGENEQASAS